MTLDPNDWDETRALGRVMVDDMLTWLETVRERPAWTSVPAESKARLAEPVPFAGAPLAEVYEAFKRDVLPFPTGNIHPRFWGWVMGTGTPTGVLADMLAAAMNPHLAGYDQSAALIERQVIAWLVELMGFPAGASGVLVSGGTEANLNGLVSARVAKAGFDVRAEGLHGGPPLHALWQPGDAQLDLPGLRDHGAGAWGVPRVPGGRRLPHRRGRLPRAYRRRPRRGRPPLRHRRQRRHGQHRGRPTTCGPCGALADEFGLWLHVDGAFGALAAWTDSRAIVAGQESADSLAFDLHKWGYMPYEVGVALTRRPDAQTAAYQPTPAAPAYLKSADGGIAVDTTYFADRGLQLSRGFRALKVWMSMKEQGVDRIAGGHPAQHRPGARGWASWSTRSRTWSGWRRSR